MSGMARIASVSAIVIVLALAGCAEPAEAPPTPSATSQPPSQLPSPSPSAAPSATPNAEPAPASASPPAGSAQPGASATATPAAARYCGDAFVLDRPHLVWWEGDEAAQLAAADVQPVFEPPDALAGLEVQCVATFTSPVDGEPGAVIRISEAFVEHDDSVYAALEAWATANGYQPTSDDRYTPWERPTDDGTGVSIFWAPIDGSTPMIGNGAEIVRQTGVDPDAIAVSHGVYSPP